MENYIIRTKPKQKGDQRRNLSNDLDGIENNNQEGNVDTATNA